MSKRQEATVCSSRLTIHKVRISQPADVEDVRFCLPCPTEIDRARLRTGHLGRDMVRHNLTLEV